MSNEERLERNGQILKKGQEGKAYGQKESLKMRSKGAEQVLKTVTWVHLAEKETMHWKNTL